MHNPSCHVRTLTSASVTQLALRNFFGIGYKTSYHLCARLGIHMETKVAELTETQVTELSAYLSSPQSVPAIPPMPTSARPVYGQKPLSPAVAAGSYAAESTGQKGLTDEEQLRLPNAQRPSSYLDPGRQLVIEAELKREYRANIMHHKHIGTVRGRRHTLGFPVHGQRTHSNAKTARKLNRIDRRFYSTETSAVSQVGLGSQRWQAYTTHPASGPVREAVEALARARFTEL